MEENLEAVPLNKSNGTVQSWILLRSNTQQTMVNWNIIAVDKK